MPKIITFPGVQAPEASDEGKPLTAAEVLALAAEPGAFDGGILIIGLNVDDRVRMVSNLSMAAENWLLDHAKHILIRDSLGLDD